MTATWVTFGSAAGREDLMLVGDGFAIEALRRCALFAGADDATLRTCASHLRTRRFRRGETIFHQGDPGDSLFIIEGGSVKIVLPSPEGAEPAIIATLGRGDFFGELSLLDGAYRSATAVAIEPTETLVLRREPFGQLVDGNPAFRAALLSGLAAELRRLTGHVEELHFLDLPGRLARRLVRMAREQDPAATGEIAVPWPFTQSELAAMIGGTRQTVNRLLADLVAQDLIRFEPDQLVVLDPERLARTAER
ncbi:MAG TPA: Crp/Fnr family transcriptional regulator [Candidatus Limnocylindrales bacterium]|nr:Crp/Fnr family transcriptional regulator [Candidatus Limnocylindrales bacterium]